MSFKLFYSVNINNIILYVNFFKFFQIGFLQAQFYYATHNAGNKWIQSATAIQIATPRKWRQQFVFGVHPTQF